MLQHQTISRLLLLLAENITEIWLTGVLMILNEGERRHIPQLAADIKVRMTLNEVERMHIPQLAADIKVRMTLNEGERMHIP